MTMFFESSVIYAVNPEDGCLDAREGTIHFADDNIHASEVATVSFQATGVERYDLAVFGVMVDESSVSEQGLLVVSAHRGIGKIAAPQAVELSRALQTKELARKCATLRDEELAQLTISGIVAQMQKRYPGIKGYER